MNDLYTKTIVVEGKTYRYDPDRDIYYAYSEESAVSRWAWLVLVVVLAVACVFLEYRPGLV
jgi:hypothetical protein